MYGTTTKNGKDIKLSTIVLFPNVVNVMRIQDRVCFLAAFTFFYHIPSWFSLYQFRPIFFLVYHTYSTLAMHLHMSSILVSV